MVMTVAITVHPDTSITMRAGARLVTMVGPNDAGTADELAADLRSEGLTVTVTYDN